MTEHHLPRAVSKMLDTHRKWLEGEPNGVQADLRYSDLEHVNLSNADLRHADMRGAYMVDAQLQHAQLSFANMASCDLRYANCEGADMRNTELRCARLNYANFKDAMVSPMILRTELQYLKDAPYLGYIEDANRVHDKPLLAGSKEWVIKRVQGHIEQHTFYELRSDMAPEVAPNSDGQYLMSDVVIVREVPAPELVPLREKVCPYWNWSCDMRGG